MIFSIIFSVTSFVTFLFIEIISRKFNLRKTLSPINIFLFSLLIYFIMYFIIHLFFNSINFERYIVSLMYYFLYVILYLHLFIGLSKSVSLRVMDEINKSPNKRLSLFKLNELYTENDFFYKRLKLMLNNNWLKNNEKIIYCSKKGSLLAKINIFFLNLYRIKNSG